MDLQDIDEIPNFERYFNGSQLISVQDALYDLYQKCKSQMARPSRLDGFFRAMYFFIAVFRMLLSSFAIIITNTKCDQPLDKWLAMMMVYDFIVIAIELLRKSKFRLPQYPSRDSQQAHIVLGSSLSNNNAVRNRYNFMQNVDEERAAGGLDIQNNQNSRGIGEVCRIAAFVIPIACKLIFLGFLFIYGQILCFNSDSNCSTVAPVLKKIFDICTLILYTTFAIPIVMIVCITLFFVFWVTVVHRLYYYKWAYLKTPKKALPTKNFNENIQGAHECSICMGEYTKNSDIVELKCSPMHHFHPECIQEWLRIKDVCPLCRKKVEHPT